MNDFAHVLRRVDGRLIAPEPQRSRILLEIAQDLEDLYGSYRDRGYSDAEARERAEEVFGAADESLHALGRLHAPLYERLLERFSHDERHRAERLLLTGLALFAVLSGAYTLLAAGAARAPSPLTWPLLGLLAVSVWALGWAGLRLHLSPYHPPTARELTPLLGLAGASVATGALAILVETWQLATTIEAIGVAGAEVALPFLRQTAELLTLALSLALAILLAWFHLRRRALEIERVRGEVLRLTQTFTRTGAAE